MKLPEIPLRYAVLWFALNFGIALVGQAAPFNQIQGDVQSPGDLSNITEIFNVTEFIAQYGQGDEQPYGNIELGTVGILAFLRDMFIGAPMLLSTLHLPSYWSQALIAMWSVIWVFVGAYAVSGRFG